MTATPNAQSVTILTMLLMQSDIFESLLQQQQALCPIGLVLKAIDRSCDLVAVNCEVFEFETRSSAALGMLAEQDERPSAAAALAARHLGPDVNVNGD